MSAVAMQSMSLTLVAEQTSIRREGALFAIFLRALVRLQVGVQILAVMVLEGVEGYKTVHVNLLIDALLLGGFVVALLEVGEWAAVPAVVTWTSFVHLITPWLLPLVAVVSGLRDVALIGVIARVILFL